MNHSSNSTCNSSTINCTAGLPPPPVFITWHQIIAVVVTILCLLGIPGNITVIIVILRHPLRPKLSMKLFFGLAVSDLVCLLLMPLTTYNYLYSWDLGDTLCKVFFVLFFCCVLASGNHILFMSMQRYFQVVHPQRWAKVGRRGEIGLLVGLWMYAVSCSLSAVSHVKVMNGHDGRIQCTSRHTEDFEVGVLVMNILLNFVIPFSILLTFYLLLQKRVNQSSFSRRTRTNRLVTRIIVCFCIFSFPIEIVYLLKLAAILADYEHLYQICKKLECLVFLCFFNSCLNPYLYAFSSQNFCQRKGQSDPVRQHEMVPLGNPPNV